jgi:hypothetical protein
MTKKSVSILGVGIYNTAIARTAERLCLLEGRASLGLHACQLQSKQTDNKACEIKKPELNNGAFRAEKHYGKSKNETSGLWVDVSCEVGLEQQRSVN